MAKVSAGDLIVVTNCSENSGSRDGSYRNCILEVVANRGPVAILEFRAAKAPWQVGERVSLNLDRTEWHAVDAEYLRIQNGGVPHYVQPKQEGPIQIKVAPGTKIEITVG